MENAVSALPGDSHKKHVVVILADSLVALDLTQANAAITYYINPLLGHLSKLNYRRSPIHVGFVTYGLLHSNGPPIEVTEFLPLGAQPKLKGIPAGQTVAGDPLGMLALDGYVEALKLIDTFKSGTGQGSKEDFSYHLWHIAAGQHDGAQTTRCDFSPTLWNARWETLPNEIKKRDVNFSMILLSPCPRFSDVFNAISPTPIEPWFQKCPHHTILLSGFASLPERGGKTSPTIPVKRPAEDPAEEGCSRRRTRRALSEPTPAPALTLVKPQQQSVYKWSGTLILHREKSPDVCLKVLVVDMIRHFNTATLPKSLEVEFLESGTQIRDMQAYTRTTGSPRGGSRTHVRRMRASLRRMRTT
ncbi:hypothetical protein BC827DRAFT_498871 [Russula dissimulans]|nr:hypothetical protein BC827DRAFT_498871 [Russula dissimulans]